MPPPNHNFVVVAPMIKKVGTGVKLDVFYTMVTKNLLRHYYYVIQMLVTPLTAFAEIWYLEVFWGAFLKYQLIFYF